MIEAKIYRVFISEGADSLETSEHKAEARSPVFIEAKFQARSADLCGEECGNRRALMRTPARRTQIESAGLVPEREARMRRDPRNGSGVQDDPRTCGYECVCMKFLVPERRHVAQTTGYELVEVVYIPSEARARVI